MLAALLLPEIMEDSQVDSSYDPNLTYEERRRLRKLKKELKLQKVSKEQGLGFVELIL